MHWTLYSFIVFLWLIASLSRATGQESASRGQQFFAQHPDGVEKLEQSWDGKMLRASPRYDPEAPPAPTFYWEVATRQKLSSSGRPTGFTRHNKVLDHDNAGFYCVRDLQSSECVRLLNLKCVLYWPEHQFSPDGSRLTLLLGGLISTWDTTSGKRLHQAPYEAVGSINDVRSTLSPDRSVLACIAEGMKGSAEFRLKLVEVRTGRTRITLPKLQYHWIGFSPDSRIFWAVSSHDPWKNTHVRFWDARTGKFLWASKGVGDVHFSPDGKLFGAPRDKEFVIFDSRTGRVVRRLQGPTSSECRAWCFSFDAKHLWSADDKGRIWLWPAD